MLHLPSDITGLTQDSRAVKEGFLFAALQGTHQDGRTFIAEAIERGARAILTQKGTIVPENLHVIESLDPSHDFALLAAAFYREQPRFIAAVTGTNGKTSVVQFARQLWEMRGLHAASLGTLEGDMTTPDPIFLHTTLAQMSTQGITHLALEASSHGLAQKRLDGVRIKTAAFTNFTRDHLDYHGSMEEYHAAKERLFTYILPKDGVAVLNADSLYIPQWSGHTLTYGFQGKDIKIVSLDPVPHGQRICLHVLGQKMTVHLPLIGVFQAMNALCAMGLVAAEGLYSLPSLVENLEVLQGVKGRMEQVDASPVYVDYAHTPDALENALMSLRLHTRGRLICVFGCGGNRDVGKRPQMGKIATRLADVVIVTDDNPRTENPAAIRAAIAAAGALEIGDRSAAITHAVRILREGDVVLIAGKGHEKGQTIAGQTYPFDDREEVQKALQNL